MPNQYDNRLSGAIANARKRTRDNDPTKPIKKAVQGSYRNSSAYRRTRNAGVSTGVYGPILPQQDEDGRVVPGGHPVDKLDTYYADKRAQNKSMMDNRFYGASGEVPGRLPPPPGQPHIPSPYGDYIPVDKPVTAPTIGSRASSGFNYQYPPDYLGRTNEPGPNYLSSAVDWLRRRWGTGRMAQPLGMHDPYAEPKATPVPQNAIPSPYGGYIPVNRPGSNTSSIDYGPDSDTGISMEEIDALAREGREDLRDYPLGGINRPASDPEVSIPKSLPRRTRMGPPPRVPPIVSPEEAEAAYLADASGRSSPGYDKTAVHLEGLRRRREIAEEKIRAGGRLPVTDLPKPGSGLPDDPRTVYVGPKMGEGFRAHPMLPQIGKPPGEAEPLSALEQKARSGAPLSPEERNALGEERGMKVGGSIRDTLIADGEAPEDVDALISSVTVSDDGRKLHAGSSLRDKLIAKKQLVDGMILDEAIAYADDVVPYGGARGMGASPSLGLSGAQQRMGALARDRARRGYPIDSLLSGDGPTDHYLKDLEGRRKERRARGVAKGRERDARMAYRDAIRKGIPPHMAAMSAMAIASPPEEGEGGEGGFELSGPGKAAIRYARATRNSDLEGKIIGAELAAHADRMRSESEERKTGAEMEATKMNTLLSLISDPATPEWMRSRYRDSLDRMISGKGVPSGLPGFETGPRFKRVTEDMAPEEIESLIKETGLAVGAATRGDGGEITMHTPSQIGQSITRWFKDDGIFGFNPPYDSERTLTELANHLVDRLKEDPEFKELMDKAPKRELLGFRDIPLESVRHLANWNQEKHGSVVNYMEMFYDTVAKERADRDAEGKKYRERFLEYQGM